MTKTVDCIREPRCWLGLVLTCYLTLGAAAQSAADTARPEVKSTKPVVVVGTHKAETHEVDGCITQTWVALATRKARASAHYNRGFKAFENVDYDAAIAAFVAAYCAVPDYRMLRNIAKAFERKSNYDKAIAYLERLIADAPKDATKAMRTRTLKRIQALKRLPARVQVGTLPPGATATLKAANGKRAQFVTSDDGVAQKIPGGEYTLSITKSDFQTITKQVELRIGQPYSFIFQLQPQVGTLRVRTRPRKARIFVDQKPVAIGSYVGQLPVGPHEIRVEAGNHLSQTQTVQLRATTETRATIDLVERRSSGRVQLLFAATIGGGLTAGGAFSTIFDQNSVTSSIGTGIGLGVGLLAGYFGVPRNISTGSSSFIITTALLGAANGIGIGAMATCDFDDNANECPGQRITAIGVASGIGGALFGALTARKFAWSAGDASMLSSGAVWGATSSVLLIDAFDLDERLWAPISLIGLNVGLGVGAVLAQRFEISRGHMALIDLAGLGGLITGVALKSATDPVTRSERLPHFALAGLAAGLTVGAILTRDLDAPAKLPRWTPHVRLHKSGAEPTVALVGARGQF